MTEKYIVELKDRETLYKVAIGGNGEPYISTAMKNVYKEPNLEAIRNEAYEKGVQDTKQHWVDAPRTCAYKLGYEKGLNDVWEAVKKIYKMPHEERMRCFGAIRPFSDQTPQEAIEKIRQYEQEKEEIRVGDEVIGIYSSGEQTKPFVITKGNSDYYFGIYRDSGEFCQGGLKLQKTGRHFPEIAEVLKKMQEETA